MSTYTFSIKNYHAVKDASIILDGITVLAGINGSGKSTLSRWISYTVSVLSQYEYLVEKFYKNNFLILFEQVTRIASSLIGTKFSRSDQYNALRRISSKAKDLEVKEIINSTLYSDAVSTLIDIMRRFIDEQGLFPDYQRLCSNLDIPYIGNEDADSFLSRAEGKLMDNYFQQSKELDNKKNSRSIEDFFDIAMRICDTDIDDDDMWLQFSEDGAQTIVNNEFRTIFLLDNSVYIDTQNIGKIWDSSSESYLKTLLCSPVKSVGADSMKIISRIREIIGGDVKYDDNDSPFYSDVDLQFVQNNGLKIALKGAATGIVCFSILLRLLQTGSISEKSVLIIDEPEAHLHPQWIVEYARMLVWINRNLGTKIMISSHNPDMVAAIQSIANKEGVLHHTHFYLAQQDTDNQKYVFHDLGQDIAPIFDSFNVALERISEYS